MNLLSIVFPGQGSQQIGMLQTLGEEYPQVRDTFTQASEVLGYDLWALTQEGPVDQLNQTQFTQPALLCASVAIFDLFMSLARCHIAVLAGHSLGEYSAYACAKSIAFTDAVQLVQTRGRLMQSAVESGKGAMAAIVGLDNARVSELCEAASMGEVVTPANDNSIGQVVVSGHTAAVERVIALALEEGARLASLLPVSVPAHCSLMKPAAEEFAQALAKTTFSKPTIPVINNVAVTMVSEPAQIRDHLLAQLTQPVRWVDTIRLMDQQGIQSIIECGPGKVLGGLIKRICRDMTIMSINDVSNLNRTLHTCEEKELI
jgi:[acyl-carrier-protein] S-malonyltransferase